MIIWAITVMAHFLCQGDIHSHTATDTKRDQME